ncbi:hypothetical protein EUGRSUZ_A01093 [Eucalyptus grandis]|uniref:Uncharacterized protein n=2 Tax=Eucalyptus grandis TaxID=71139 RepID=A0ACC3M516_EUCGR|nr:hypothetical protein EUGRSUZ_A01093 [Eucalyptus grandis]
MKSSYTMTSGVFGVLYLVLVHCICIHKIHVSTLTQKAFNALTKGSNHLSSSRNSSPLRRFLNLFFFNEFRQARFV